MTIQQRLRGNLQRKFEITEEQADALIAAGLHTIKRARQASEDELVKAGLPEGKITKIKGK